MICYTNTHLSAIGVTGDRKRLEKGLRKIAVGEVMVVDVTERLLRMEALTCT